MCPVITTVFGMPIFGYGLFAGIGFLAWLGVTCLLAARVGSSPEHHFDAILIALCAGVFGARALALVGTGLDPLTFFDFRGGGLSFFGGLALAIPALLYWFQHKGIDPWLGLDLQVPGFMLGMAFGRLGCLARGCCYGYPDPGPLAVHLAGSPGGARFPIQALDALAHLACFFVLIRFFRVKGPLPMQPGALFAAGLCLLSAQRFLVEFFRADNPRYFSLTSYQYFSLALFCATVLMILFKGRTVSRAATSGEA